ncbi:hypothetical protein UlMin_032839 [Ulmus minor]
MFGFDEEVGSQVPTQVQTLVEGSRSVLVLEYKPMPNPFSIGFFGTRNMGFMHQLLTVILPQRLKKQSPESQELLSKNVIEKPHNNHLTRNFLLASVCLLCKMDIISHVQQVICFAFRDSRMLMETCQKAKNLQKIITLFYLN